MAAINKVILSVSQSAVFKTKFVPAYFATMGVAKKNSVINKVAHNRFL
jgi:hypothetical protein